MPRRGQTPYERKYTHERYYARGSKGNGARDPWTYDEDVEITARGRPSDEILSLELDRTILAIQVRRCRLRKDA